MALAAPAWAIGIPYSKGTLTIDSARTVTVGAGGDYASCAQAMASFPAGGPGGVIEFLPGNHVGACGWSSGNRGSFLITGRLGPNGERPRITTDTRTSTSGQTSKEPFLVLITSAPVNLVVQNLEIVDTGGGVDVNGAAGVILRNVKIDGVEGESGVAIRDPNPAAEAAGYEMWLEIYDSEVAHAGGANVRHNLYINRIDRVLIDGLYSHSANNSHALKVEARDVTVRNSTLATTSVGTAFANIPANDYQLSTTLLDMASCGTSLVENNRFVGANILRNERSNPGWGQTTAAMIDYQRRKTGVGGCDDPAYGTTEFNDPAFWADAAADGYNLSNQDLLTQTVRNNTFVNIGNNPIAAVWNHGSAPLVDDSSFYTNIDLPLPPGWFERSVTRLDNNRVVGDVPFYTRDWLIHPDYQHTAPVFVDGVRVDTFSGNPLQPVRNGASGTTPPPSSGGGKPTPPVVGKPPGPTPTPGTTANPRPVTPPTVSRSVARSFVRPATAQPVTPDATPRKDPSLLGQVSRTIDSVFSIAVQMLRDNQDAYGKAGCSPQCSTARSLERPAATVN